MPVRMKDIARDLGVSVVTVSKVLRNHSDISEQTKERVMQRIKELNYRPNLAARALVTGRSFIVGLVVPDLIHTFFADVEKGLADTIRQKGYNVVIASSGEDTEFERQEVEQLLARRVDALILASAQTTAEHLAAFAEQHRTPFILVDRKIEGLDAPFVGVDDELVGQIGTEHLVEVGCKRIAHIAGPVVSTALGRQNGYRRTLEKHGMTPGPEYVVTLEHGDRAVDEAGYDSMKQLLALPVRPDGVFCHNDPAAMGAMRAIFEAGLRIPEDIAVVGCGNVHYGKFLRVPITSVDQSSQSIGEQAGVLALSMIESKGQVAPRSILIEPKLVVRESSRR